MVYFVQNAWLYVLKFTLLLADELQVNKLVKAFNVVVRLKHCYIVTLVGDLGTSLMEIV